MEALIRSITEKTGISKDQASTAINTVVSFLKDKMPAGMGSQVESFLGGSGTATGGREDTIKSKMGGLF